MFVSSFQGFGLYLAIFWKWNWLSSDMAQTKYYLIWISVEVEVFQEPSGKLTEQEVVGLIDCPQTPVCVVIGTGTGTEWTHYKHIQKKHTDTNAL